MQRSQYKIKQLGVLGRNVCDWCQIDKVAVQNLLSCGELNTTREASPRSSCVNSVGDPFPFRSKANYLLQDLFPFFVYSTTRLKHHRSEVVIRVNKRRSVAISFLSFGVRLTRLLQLERGLASLVVFNCRNSLEICM